MHICIPSARFLANGSPGSAADQADLLQNRAGFCSTWGVGRVTLWEMELSISCWKQVCVISKKVGWIMECYVLCGYIEVCSLRSQVFDDAGGDHLQASTLFVEGRGGWDVEQISFQWKCRTSGICFEDGSCMTTLHGLDTLHFVAFRNSWFVQVQETWRQVERYKARTGGMQLPFWQCRKARGHGSIPSLGRFYISN